MIVGTAEIKLYAPWVSSLKEKRMLVKSIIARTQNKFNVSIAEVAEQDTHQTIMLGIACVAGNVRQSDSIIDHVIAFIEGVRSGNAEYPARNKMRLFIGIEFPEDTIAGLYSLQNDMRKLIRKGRFPARENLHLTLQFLGETPESRVRDIACALGAAARNHRRFELSFADRLGYFGLRNPVRVVWLGLKGDLAPLLRLQASIVASTRELGFACEDSDYHAHVTLAREADFFNGGDLFLANGLIEYAVGDFPVIPVDRFALLSSRVEQGKIVYSALETLYLCNDDLN